MLKFVLALSPSLAHNRDIVTGMSPLHFALFAQSIEMIRLLVGSFFRLFVFAERLQSMALILGNKIAIALLCSTMRDCCSSLNRITHAQRCSFSIRMKIVLLR